MTPEVGCDDNLQRDVLAELAWDPQVRSTGIGVAVRDGVVTLSGWVDSYARKWAAERAAHRVRGVRALAGDLEVRLDVGEERTDADIAVAVVRGMEWDAFVPVDRVDVTVANGWVMLRGEVEWSYQKRAAERVVRRMSGVRGVTNFVEVHPPARPPSVGPGPERLAGGIRAALGRILADADVIDVDVQGDSVILNGTVRSWLEREEAERIAWSAPGVSDVRTRLEIAG